MIEVESSSSLRYLTPRKSSQSFLAILKLSECSPLCALSLHLPTRKAGLFVSFLWVVSDLRKGAAATSGALELRSPHAHELCFRSVGGTQCRQPEWLTTKGTIQWKEMESLPSHVWCLKRTNMDWNGSSWSKFVSPMFEDLSKTRAPDRINFFSL